MKNIHSTLKNIILTTIFSICMLGTTIVQAQPSAEQRAQQIHAVCSKIVSMATLFANLKYSGEPITTVINEVNGEAGKKAFGENQDLARDIAISVYSMLPDVHTPEYQQRATTEMVNAIYLECYAEGLDFLGGDKAS